MRYGFLREEFLVLNAWAIVFASVFLLGFLFTQKTNQPYACCYLLQFLMHNPHQVQHELTCYHNCIKDEGDKQNKTKIGVGSVIKAKVGELENITR